MNLLNWILKYDERHRNAWRLTQALVSFTLALNYDAESGIIYSGFLTLNAIVLIANVTGAWVERSANATH